VVVVLMSCAMSVAERCRIDSPQGVAVEPGREEPTLKVQYIQLDAGSGPVL
jgi:hypothetical protein